MKVIIGTGLHGFGISNEALFLAIQRGCTTLRTSLLSEWNLLEDSFRLYKDDFSVWCQFGDQISENWLTRDGIVYEIDGFDDEVRADPILVNVVEELGEKAWNQEFKMELKVVEIPDDVEFYINRPDVGGESIHENHRMWY